MSPLPTTELPDIALPDEPQQRAPKFGEKGFRKGQPNPRKGTPRARITEKDATLIAFASKLPAGTAEAFSYLLQTAESPISDGGKLISQRTANDRLEKLVRLGAVEKFIAPTTKQTHYGATQQGYEIAQDFGYDQLLAPLRRIDGLSVSRLRHYALIALIGAQLTSPLSPFGETLGLPALGIDTLVSENEMRYAYERANKGLRKNGFGKWRQQALTEAFRAVKENRLGYSDILTAYPALLTVAHPHRDSDSKQKAVLQPDLALNLDALRDSASASNLLIEIELSKKSWEAYDTQLRMLKTELSKPYIYSKAVYFTAGTQVETLLKKVNRAGEYGLFESGKLTVLPITHRDGRKEKSTQRVVARTGGRS